MHPHPSTAVDMRIEQVLTQHFPSYPSARFLGVFFFLSILFIASLEELSMSTSSLTSV